MTPALLLIDLQQDYLDAPGLEPCASRLCGAVARLLNVCRSAGIPIVHVWTTVADDGAQMPHWRQSGLRRCRPGTPGHSTPELLRPRTGEAIAHKRFYSAFGSSELAAQLHAAAIDTVILAGLHLRACVRSTAIDAYQSGFTVWVADNAVADNDPLHASITRRYLRERLARFLSVSEIEAAVAPRAAQSAGTLAGDPHSLPATVLANNSHRIVELPAIDHVCPYNRRLLWRVPVCQADQVSQATAAARDAGGRWAQSARPERAQTLLLFSNLVEQSAEPLARQIVEETGKPMRDARLEIGFAVDLVRSTVAIAGPSQAAAEVFESGPGWSRRRLPLGVVALVTPWNNPLAIPLGKLAPALIYGNTVTWKPALPGAALALRVCELLRDAGLPPGVLTLVQGDRDTGERLFSDECVDAVSLTGSAAAGFAAQAICGKRRIPLQAELGGNNAAIVWHDADFDDAARKIVAAGFGAAGQRCTANRRVVVDRAYFGAWLQVFCEAAGKLSWGDPRDEVTDVGPVISASAFERISDVVERARARGHRVYSPHAELPHAADLRRQGWYFPPTIVVCDDPRDEIVQEETFGPVIVVQPADDWEQAIHLCNGVSQGLVAAVFTRSTDRQQQFLAAAQAGLLKINQATAGAASGAPFGGWKASGIGPPEHGVADREFFTRHQAVYQNQF
jgi:acyl-CoA reductase-like NAD-dependent aldehyde dehydrogenase/isochorismate hydrolase